MPSSKSTTKLTVNLSQEVVDILRDLADREGTTMTEVLRRAIAVQKYLADEQDEGKNILIEDPEKNTVRQLVLK
ncbi:ribbon-helix-helix protein, CopG family [Actinophytocola sp. KF-1]